MWRGYEDDRINCFNIQDYMKKDKGLLKYLKGTYNKNRPIIGKKRFEYIWYVFIMDCANTSMKDELYNIILNIPEPKK